MSEELKPCPFCGSNPEYTAHSKKLVVCHASGCPIKDLLLFTEKWQSRPIEDTLRAENERLTAEVARLKAALKIYANDDNWDDRGGWVNCFFAYGNCEGMDVARAALAERRMK